MVTCSCGKTIDKLPVWLEGVKVEFICNNCPNRQTKNIAFIQLEAAPTDKSRPDDDENMPEDDPEPTDE